MGKRVNTKIQDDGLNYAKDNCDKLVICSQEPTTYAEANVTYALGAVTGLDSTDFTVGDGDSGGVAPRKITVAEQTGTASATGTATHVAWLNTTGSELLYVTELTSQVVTSGNPITIPAHKLEKEAVA